MYRASQRTGNPALTVADSQEPTAISDTSVEDLPPLHGAAARVHGAQNTNIREAVEKRSSSCLVEECRVWLGETEEFVMEIDMADLVLEDSAHDKGKRQEKEARELERKHVGGARCRKVTVVLRGTGYDLPPFLFGRELGGFGWWVRYSLSKLFAGCASTDLVFDNELRSFTISNL